VSHLPPDEIISSHNIDGPTTMIAAKCFFLCEKDGKCVGFNFRTQLNTENCQLTNVIQNRNENETRKGDWTLFRDSEAVCRLNFN
ncbi:Hypothetical predicted protein, partial [Paramuricea clavata]